MKKSVIALLSISLCATIGRAELATVANVDLDRYIGVWEEIARFENKHQIGCSKSRAEYKKDGDKIAVKNSCTLTDGKSKEVTGTAKVGDEKDNAKLKVNFTPFFIRMFGVGWGNYHIIELGAEYDYAVVSEPTMQYLWILSRHRPMKKDLYDAVVKRLQEKGFDTSKLVVESDAVASVAN